MIARALIVSIQRFKQGFILQPVCVSPQMKVRDAISYEESHGFSGFPVTADGEVGGQLLGLVTGRDFDFLETDAYDTTISEVHHAVPHWTVLKQTMLWSVCTCFSAIL